VLLPGVEGNGIEHENEDEDEYESCAGVFQTALSLKSKEF
jgi:hypothetical protein